MGRVSKIIWAYTGWDKALVKEGIGIMDGIRPDNIANPVIDEPNNYSVSLIHNYHPNEDNWMKFRWDVCDTLLPIPDSQWGEGLEWNHQGVGVEWRDICEERIQND
jgi:hypothetical protein